ncbi:zeta-carotene desaturase [Cucumis melo var. makuwa]|uniref:Zeta-carotene desaturase n=1 Tax=Cucumis melo var. makuwa TaxID=1194695 RepID=A0A5D3BA78_CUCMM|nr:zeta-carotene desaturase [Cucumis melo var. makuwa]
MEKSPLKSSILGGTRASIQRMWDPVAYALGFIDCDDISARCMLTIFSLFATKTEASLLRMLKGSPDVFLSGPIRQYITDRGGRFHLRWGCREVLYDKFADGETYIAGLAMSKATNKKVVKADAYVAACDVPGIKRLIPSQWREWEFFDNIYKLIGVPVVTVQLRYNGWVTELQDLERSRQLRQAVGLDNLLYTPDADFSCFADLALTSPEDYYIEGQGSLLQCVLTPGDPYMPLLNDEIIARVAKQVLDLFPSSQGLEVIWSSVVKIGQSLYREAPGKDPFRPDQKTPIKNFFLAGSYTKQDYIDSMEGATLSGRQASAYICDSGEELMMLREKIGDIESETAKSSDELNCAIGLDTQEDEKAGSKVTKIFRIHAISRDEPCLWVIDCAEDSPTSKVEGAGFPTSRKPIRFATNPAEGDVIIPVTEDIELRSTVGQVLMAACATTHMTMRAMVHIVKVQARVTVREDQ